MQSKTANRTVNVYYLKKHKMVCMAALKGRRSARCIFGNAQGRRCSRMTVCEVRREQNTLPAFQKTGRRSREGGFAPEGQ